MDMIRKLNNDGMGFGSRSPDVNLLRAGGLVVSVHCSWERTTYAVAEVVPTICEPRLESTLNFEGKVRYVRRGTVLLVCALECVFGRGG